MTGNIEIPKLKLSFLKDFDEAPISTSPRLTEACRLLGVESDELVKRSLEYFLERYSEKDNYDFIVRRCKRYERNRVLLLKSVHEKRDELVEATLRGTYRPWLLRAEVDCQKGVYDVRERCNSAFTDPGSPPLASEQEFEFPRREARELERIQRQKAIEVRRILERETKIAAREQKERKSADKTLIGGNWKSEKARKKDASELQKSRRLERERNKKQEDARLQAEKYYQQQRKEVEYKQQEMARRDAQRCEKIEAHRRRKASEMARKFQRNKLRISNVLNDKELIKAQQLSEYEHKQQQSELRRLQFEKNRQEREKLARCKAHEKRMATEAVQRHLQEIEQRRREYSERINEQVEERLLEKEKKQYLERSQRAREQARQEYDRKLVYERVRALQEEKQALLLHKYNAKEITSRKIQENRRRMLQRGIEDAQLKIEEVQAALVRRQKADAYNANLIELRIALDDERTQTIREKRKCLLRHRRELQRAADRKKNEFVKIIEKLKRVKNFQTSKKFVSDLLASSFPVNVDERLACAPPTRTTRARPLSASVNMKPKVSNSRPSSASHRLERIPSACEIDIVDENKEDTFWASIRELQKRQIQELLCVLDEEQQAEENREYLLTEMGDEEERTKMDMAFDAERADASQRIMDITHKHEMVMKLHTDSVS